MLAGRRRAIGLAALALAVPLPALAASEGALSPLSSGPTALAVSTSLQSCGLADSQIVCRISVSYNALPGATSYTASVTRADGSVVDYGAVASGGTTLTVPYAGSGSYSVRVTAYGTPPEPAAEPQVISTEVSEADAEAGGRGDQPSEPPEADAEAGARDPEAGANADADGTLEAEPACSEAVPEPAPEPPLSELPEPPPVDVDPENPDEDADGVADEQERVVYDAAVAEQQAEAGVPETPESVECP